MSTAKKPSKLPADSLILNFLHSKGFSSAHISLLVLIQLTQILSFLVDPNLKLYSQSGLWIRLGQLLQYPVVCLANLIQITNVSEIFPVASLAEPTFMICAISAFLLMNWAFKRSDKAPYVQNHIIPILAGNLMLFLLIVAPYPFFEQFFHTITCKTSLFVKVTPELNCYSGKVIRKLDCRPFSKFDRRFDAYLSFGDVQSEIADFRPNGTIVSSQLRQLLDSRRFHIVHHFDVFALHLSIRLPYFHSFGLACVYSMEAARLFANSHKQQLHLVLLQTHQNGDRFDFCVCNQRSISARIHAF